MLNSKMLRCLLLSFLFLTCSGMLKSQYADFRTADSLAGANQWDKAGEIYKQLAESNKYNGYYWSNYAYSMYLKHDYKKAIELYLECAKTGYNLQLAYYNIACCYALLNDAENAVNWLDTAAIYKMTSVEETVSKDSDFDAVRNSAQYKTRVIPLRSSFRTREEGWKADLEFFRKRMAETHYNIFGRMNERAWDHMIDSLKEHCGELNDYQMAAGLYSLTRMVGDGHTTVFRPDNEMISINVLPVSMFLFEDGLYVIAAAKPYAELAGKKVVKLGTYDVPQLLEELRKVTPRDNEFGFMARCVKLMTFNGLMYGLGVTKSPTETEITIEGGRVVTVKAEKLVNGEFRSDMSPSEWVMGKDTSVTPLYMENMQNTFNKKFIPGRKIMYARFNGIHDTKEQKLHDFFAGVMDDANKNDAEYLVLDIRNNGGGDSYNNKFIVQSIVKNERFNRKGHLFVIIGRVTFSAAVNLCGYLERETEALFVGEPTGSPPNFVGENNLILLPYSGITVSCSSRYWQNAISIDYRKWIEAELGVRYFYDDFKRGYDPAIEEVFKFIDR